MCVCVGGVEGREEGREEGGKRCLLGHGVP